MKVPISWLKEYVAFEDSPQGLADKLTFSGIEVEGIETVGGDFAGLVVGEVVQVDAHPQADRLTVCRVTTGDAEHQVVCGAPNAAVGLKAPFAPIGTVLPNGMKMKKAKIRGIESFGMLLAEDELGLSDDHTGLLELDAAWAAGTPLAEVLGPPETVLDLEITPNRPDCLSLIGIAREVAALYGTSLRWPTVELVEGDAPVTDRVRVDVEDTAACPRYTARYISGVQVRPSPEWMQRRLTLAGVRPINNVVDITNYVMLECGHPLHAFDYGRVAGGHVVVRRARAGETMQTLDESERKLTPDMLVIADDQAAVAVAGVMGGAGSEIRESTDAVLLESACFDPLLVRSVSRSLALSTESSYRFERGVDAETVDWASRRAAALLAEWGGGVVARGVIDCYPAPAPTRSVRCEWEYVRKVTGMAVDNPTITAILSALELQVDESDEVGFTVRVPSFRGDLERRVDIVEEIARMHGLDQIPTPPPRAQMIPGAHDRPVRALRALKARLVGLGLREIMNYSLTSPALLELFSTADADERVALPNPISADQSVLRPSLLPQMVETMGRNHARQIPEALLFEAGRVFRRAASGDGVAEADRISLGLMGPVGRGPYAKRAAITGPEMFSWMKGLIEHLVAGQGLGALSVALAEHPEFEPGQGVDLVVDGEVVGRMGLLRAAIRREWRLSQPVAVAELSTAALLQAEGRPVRAKAVPVYPAIARDMALVVDARVSHADILGVIRENAQKDLEKIELFDIFESEAIGSGRKSMAYSVTYRSHTRTLTDEDANAYHDQVKDALRRELDVAIREN